MLKQNPPETQLQVKKRPSNRNCQGFIETKKEHLPLKLPVFLKKRDHKLKQ
jgi:hypothetical protein